MMKKSVRFVRQTLDIIFYRSHIASRADDRTRKSTKCIFHRSPEMSLLYGSTQFQHDDYVGYVRRILPSRRDREVPYGMKGGEHSYGNEEARC
jgi:hypothetical protein